MTDLLLGIDVGTTWCKAAAVSIEGRELAHDRVPVSWRAVRGGAEIDPERLFELAVMAGSEPSGGLVAAEWWRLE